MYFVARVDDVLSLSLTLSLSRALSPVSFEYIFFIIVLGIVSVKLHSL